MGIESNGYVLFETRDTAFGSSHTHVGIIDRKPRVRNCPDKPKTQAVRHARFRFSVEMTPHY